MSDYQERPPRGGYRGGHDNRTVSYGPSRGRGGFKSKNRVKRNVGSFRPRYEGGRDEDVDMDGGDNASTSKQRHAPYDSRRGGRGRGGGRGRKPRGGRMGQSGMSLRMAAMDEHRDHSALRRLGLPVQGGRGGGGGGTSLNSKSGWFKVHLPYAAEAGKNWLLQALSEQVATPFTPIKFSLHGKNASFMLNDPRAARSLKEVSRRISLPNGAKLMISVVPCADPEMKLSDDVIEKVKVAMSGRYDPATKILDLSNVYAHPDLRKEGIYLSIGRPSVAESVLKIIKENIPELLVLNLSNNRLYNLNSWKELGNSCPCVTAIDFSRNELKSIYDLDKIKNCTAVTELTLNHNPMRNNYNDTEEFTSAVRERFPKLMKLDGKELPALITFATEPTDTTLPPYKGSRFPNPQVQDLVCRFLKQYYDLFDSTNRQALLDAYHEDAVFSLSAAFNPLFKKQGGFSYMQESRNMMRVMGYTKKEKLFKILKTSKLSVVAALNQFPTTKHDPASFVVDVTLVTDKIIHFTVSGIFTEPESHREPVRSFSRTFIAVPSGPGMAIVNEQLSITNATEKQVKESFKSPAPTPVSSPAPAGAPAGALTPEQQAAVKEFSDKSTMNLEFSMKCLQECNWDFNKAAAAFTEAKAAGGIPPEAFIK